jgi:hypothetical protein
VVVVDLLTGIRLAAARHPCIHNLYGAAVIAGIVVMEEELKH